MKTDATMSQRPLDQLPELRSVSTTGPLDGHDALVLVVPSPAAEHVATLARDAADAARQALAADAALAGGGLRAPVVVASPAAPGGRLVLSVLGPLTDETDDVRAVAEASAAAVSRAVDAGAARPVLAIAAPDAPRFARAREVAALSAVGSQWQPLETREAGKASRRAELVGVVGLDPAVVGDLAAVDAGRALCRDIGGTEPERMAPRRVAELCRETFAGTPVTVSVEDDVSSYPLIAAVARASMVVERHRPCVVRLEHAPRGAVHHTVVLVGKGVCYDTGGADLKTDGHMAGMSRDKGGAAAVAGVMRAVSLSPPDGVRVIGLLGLVRNSVGEEALVSDEIVRARSGVRVRIGNTDAEGRLVLADLLSAAREELSGVAPAPVLLSLATLTGHVYRAFGPYVGAIGNAHAQRAVEALDTLGELWGEPMEHTRPRREDYAMVAPKSSAEDVMSSNRLASVNTPRGHQFPFAFLDVASGLRRQPIPLLHLDIAGVAVDPPDWQVGRPTGSPVATLVAWIRSL